MYAVPTPRQGLRSPSATERSSGGAGRELGHPPSAGLLAHRPAGTSRARRIPAPGRRRASRTNPAPVSGRQTMARESLQTLYVEQLRDLYSAEQQILKAL